MSRERFLCAIELLALAVHAAAVIDHSISPVALAVALVVAAARAAADRLAP